MRLNRKFFYAVLIALGVYSGLLLFISLNYRQSENNRQNLFLKESYMNFKQEELKNLIAVSQSVVDNILNQDISEKDKKSLIIESLSNISFKNGQGYYGAYEIRKDGIYWLFNGANPILNGQKALLDTKDADGVRYIEKIIENSKKDSFTEYKYFNPLTKNIEKKLTYSYFEPTLNIVVYTGFYITDIENNLTTIEKIFKDSSDVATKNFIFIAALITLVMAIVASTASKRITEPINILSKGLKKFSKGQLHTRVDIKTNDEIEELSESFNNLAEKLEFSISEREYLIDKIDMLLGATINLFNLQNHQEFLSSIFHLIFDFIPVDYVYANFKYGEFDEFLLADKKRMIKIDYTDENRHLLNEKDALINLLNSDSYFNNAESIINASKTRVLNLNANGKHYGYIKLIITKDGKEFPSDTEKLLAHFYALVDMFLNLNEMNEEMLESYRNFAVKLALVAEAHDSDTGNHVVRVGKLAGFLARELKIPMEESQKIENFAPLHDIGKIFIPKELLTKSGHLTPEEWDLMKTHTSQAYKILGEDKKFQTALNIAKYHHEKFDGTGYPYGLRGSLIPLEAQIVAIVDVYDALRSKRPYKDSFSHETAIDIIINGDGRTEARHFNPEIIRIFMEKSDIIKNFWDSIW